MSVKELENLLHQAVTDAEFRRTAGHGSGRPP